MEIDFRQLFVGSDKTHGHWTKEAGYSTDKGPASDQDYQDHLNGIKGLGLVPVRPDGTCAFAAIDIDDDSIDHQALYKKVKARNLPLHVCRSKSGGAHCYIFFPKPWPAKAVMVLLRRWAGVLGYPKCEVFPKQDHIDDKNFGNWINLPYFGGDSTTRYCVGDRGALSLEEFQASIRYYSSADSIDESATIEVEHVKEMPPCLQVLTQNGLPEGTRNNGLFNFAAFYRRSSPNGWEDKVKEHNKLYLKPPLTDSEVRTIIKSAGRTNYQYTCNQEPICSHCDRRTCMSLEFGVGRKPWDEANSYDEFVVCNLRKINTDPPRYKVEVNSTDIELDTAQVMDYLGFKRRVMEVLDILLPPMKKEMWDRYVKELLTKIQVIEAPKDASLTGMIMVKVHEFLSLSERAKKHEDLLKGIPYKDQDTVYFRPLDLQKYLQAARFMIPNQELYQMILNSNGGYEDRKINGKQVGVWYLKLAPGTIQTEDFHVNSTTQLPENL